MHLRVIRDFTRRFTDHTEKHYLIVYLTMFSVQYLKALYVLQLNTIGKRFPLEVNVCKLWECSGCIWDMRTQNTHFKSQYSK